MRFAIALVGATIAISFSDWLFFGLLFHDRYMQTPAVWRESPESRKIAGSMAFAVVGTAAFLFLAQTLGVRGFGPTFGLAFLVWIAASAGVPERARAPASRASFSSFPFVRA